MVPTIVDTAAYAPCVLRNDTTNAHSAVKPAVINTIHTIDRPISPAVKVIPLENFRYASATANTMPVRNRPIANAEPM